MLHCHYNVQGKTDLIAGMSGMSFRYVSHSVQLVVVFFGNEMKITLSVNIFRFFTAKVLIFVRFVS